MPQAQWENSKVEKSSGGLGCGASSVETWGPPGWVSQPEGRTATQEDVQFQICTRLPIPEGCLTEDYRSMEKISLVRTSTWATPCQRWSLGPELHPADYQFTTRPEDPTARSGWASECTASADVGSRCQVTVGRSPSQLTVLPSPRLRIRLRRVKEIILIDCHRCRRFLMDPLKARV
jgi:hypothetical protein